MRYELDAEGQPKFKLTASALDALHQNKRCEFCNSVRDRNSVEAVFLNNKLCVIGSSCFDKLRTSYYFKEERAAKSKNEYVECAVRRSNFTDLYQVLGFVNEYELPFINSSIAKIYRGFKDMTPVNQFANHAYVATNPASEEAVQQLIEEAKNLDENNDFAYKIKRIIEEAAQNEHHIVEVAALPFLLGYLFARKENNLFNETEDAGSSYTEDTIAAKLVFIKKCLSKQYGNVYTKFYFKTFDNKLIIRNASYLNEEDENARVGDDWMFCTKSLVAKTERNHQVYYIKRSRRSHR